MVMNLLCPAWIRRKSATGFVGIRITFRWDTLGGPDRFHDWLKFWIAVKETAPYHPSPGEPGRQADQRVDGCPVGWFRAENAKLIEFSNDASCCLPVAAPQSGKVNLRGYELPWL